MNPNNHIEQLIHDLCPSGVPQKTLGEVCHLKRGRGLSKNDIVPTSAGTLPIILYGELYTAYSGHIKEIKSSAVKEKAILGTEARISDLLLPISSTTKEAQIGCAADLLIDKTIYVGGDAIVLSHHQNPGYLVYYINSARFEKEKMACVSGTTIRHLSPTKLMQISIPLPPLPIQEEIVRILDTFTELITNIDTEIQKQQCELDLCRKQIFHQLNCKYEQLSSIFDMRGGYTPSTKNPEYWTDNTGYSWYTMDDIRKNGRKLGNSIRHITEKAIKGKGLFPKGTIVFATSATIGEHAILMKPALTNQRFTAIIPKKDDVYMMFYYHYAFIIDEWCLQHIKRGGFNSVDMDGFAKLPIPLPPLSEQRAIAEKLDTFEKLITNLKAERDLRQQQYEYYREKLINLLK